MKEFSCNNCGSNNISKIDYGFSDDPMQGYSYIKPLLDSSKISVDSFFTSQSRYICLDCKIKFLKPWLTIEQRNLIFIDKKSRHNAAWDSLERSISNPSQLKLQSISYKFLNKAFEHIDKESVKNYAEYNSPFTGPSLYYFSVKNTYKKKLKLFLKAISVPSDSLTILSKTSDFFQKISNFFIKILIQTRRIRTLKNEKKIKLNSYSFLKNPDLIVENSTCFWSSNNVTHSKSILYMGLKLIFKSVNYMENTSKKYDLIFLSNVFDHIDKPTKTLEMLLNISDNIIVQTHHSNSVGYQHLYSIGQDFFKKFVDTRNLDLISLGNIEFNSYNETCYLIKKR